MGVPCSECGLKVRSGDDTIVNILQSPIFAAACVLSTEYMVESYRVTDERRVGKSRLDGITLHARFEAFQYETSQYTHEVTICTARGMETP